MWEGRGDAGAGHGDGRLMVLAAALGLLIGIVIGGLGGGGGVLAVPVMVYVLGQSAQDATTTSVIVVAVASAFGVAARLRAGAVVWRTALAFGAVGIPAAALGSVLNQRVAQPVLLLSFAALTVLAAAAMFLHSRGAAADAEPYPSAGGPPSPRRAGVAVADQATARAVPRTLGTVARTVCCGLVIGFLTGFLGVGGGFLLVPALAIVMGMPMTNAVATSLLIIAVNSVAALGTRAGVAHFDWAVLVPFTVAAVVGSLMGTRVAGRLSGATLGTAFAMMLLLVGSYVGVESVLAL